MLGIGVNGCGPPLLSYCPYIQTLVYCLYAGPKHLPGGPKRGQDHGYYNLTRTELGWIAPLVVVVVLVLCVVTQRSRCQQQGMSTFHFISFISME